jgi:hypothetical protein
MAPPRIHDDNPDPSGRGDRKALRRAPATGDVVGRRSRPGPYDDEDDDGPTAEDLERFGGETRTCPECKKEVFDDTAVCYHCGHAFMGTAHGAPGKSKTWIIVIVVLLIGIFVFGAMRGVF